MSWTHIVIHHSADHDDPWVDAKDYEDWHRKKGWRDIGYHKVVELIDNRYYSLDARPLYMVGAHSPGWNDIAIGVCFAGNFMEEQIPLEQLIVGAECVAGLCASLGISPGNILRHSESQETGYTDCPGDFFPFVDFIRIVSGFIEGAEVKADG
jgi:hypothetical protein